MRGVASLERYNILMRGVVSLERYNILMRVVASLERYNIVVFCYLSESEIWPSVVEVAS